MGLSVLALSSKFHFSLEENFLGVFCLGRGGCPPDQPPSFVDKHIPGPGIPGLSAAAPQQDVLRLVVGAAPPGSMPGHAAVRRGMASSTRMRDGADGWPQQRQVRHGTVGDVRVPTPETKSGSSATGMRAVLKEPNFFLAKDYP